MKSFIRTRYFSLKLTGIRRRLILETFNPFNIFFQKERWAVVCSSEDYIFVKSCENRFKFFLECINLFPKFLKNLISSKVKRNSNRVLLLESILIQKKILWRINFILIKFLQNKLLLEKLPKECKKPSFLHKAMCIQSDHSTTKIRCCLSSFMAWYSRRFCKNELSTFSTLNMSSNEFFVSTGYFDPTRQSQFARNITKSGSDFEIL